MAEQVDRRVMERYKVSADVSCPFVSPVLEDFGTVKIRDVSMHGVGLVMHHHVEPGIVLTVALVNPARDFNKMVLARVVHITPLGSGFLVGCSFLTPLTYQEMSALIL